LFSPINTLLCTVFLYLLFVFTVQKYYVLLFFKLVICTFHFFRLTLPTKTIAQRLWKDYEKKFVSTKKNKRPRIFQN
jgi:hypothetical protein